MKKQLLTAVISGAVILGGSTFNPPVADAAGKGPEHQGNETVNTQILHSYKEMMSDLERQNKKQEHMEVEVIGQTVKGRDIPLVKYLNNPDNPTILYLAQQHGDEALTTKGMLDFIKSLGTGKMKDVLEGVNILMIPMYNADGAMADVNYELEGYAAKGPRHLTRYNANHVDLNRDHAERTQPETQALHQNVLQKYDIDYMMDLHHQGAQWVKDGKYVSGAIFILTLIIPMKTCFTGQSSLEQLYMTRLNQKAGDTWQSMPARAPHIARESVCMVLPISMIFPRFYLKCAEPPTMPMTLKYSVKKVTAT